MSLFSLILSNAVELRRDLSIFFNRVSVKTLLITTSGCYINFFLYSLFNNVTIFNALFSLCFKGLFFHFLIVNLSFFIVNLNAFYPRKLWLKDLSTIYDLLRKKILYYKQTMLNLFGEIYKIKEYCLIIIFILSGGSYLICANDLISIFLSLELQSFGLYILPALYRDSELAITGALTYFLLGSLASCFILLGSSLLYINTAITNLDSLYVVTNVTPEGKRINWYFTVNYLYLSLIIVSVGLLFKISAAPFHFWSPDVYDMLPTIVTTYLSIIAKISILKLFFDLIYYTNNDWSEFNWTDALMLSSLSCLIIGTVVGLTQTRIKKIYAYSTISHLGFILLCLKIYNLESIKGFIFYLTSYSFSNLNGFLLLLSIGFYLYKYTNSKNNYKYLLDCNNSPIQLVDQIKGYFYLNCLLSLSLAVTLFSFIGIPPLIGFFAKQMVLSAALSSGYVFISLIAIITSVIGAVYYLNIIQTVFFNKSDYVLNQKMENTNFYVFIVSYLKKVNFNLSNITLSNCFSLPISIFNMFITFFIFVGKELETFCFIVGSSKVSIH